MIKIPKTRRGLQNAIFRLVKPHFVESGYMKHLDPSKGIFGPKRNLLLWKPKHPLIVNGFVLDDVLAITEDGIMVDGAGGGAVTYSYGCFPIEDLQKLYKKLVIFNF